MDWGKIAAVLASAVVIAVTAAALMGSSFEAETEGDLNKAALDSYLKNQYDNADSYPTRLLILGNADMDDDLDEDDMALIELTASAQYDYVSSYFCDANYDGVIDSLDADMVRELMDLDYAGTVNYLNCDFKIRSYDMGMPLRTSNILTQTLEMLCVLCPESVVAVDDRCSETGIQGQYWKEFASVLDYGKMGHVGSHKAPSAEKYLMVAKEYGDGYLTAVMNSEYAQSTGYMEKQLSNTTVQIVRIPSWERGGICCGMLTLGYMFHSYRTAVDWVAWHDSYYDDIMDRVSKLADDQRKKAVVSVLGDTDISSLDKFQINFTTSGEYQNLIRMGVIDVGGQYLRDKGLAGAQWEVEISREGFIAMYTDYGIDCLIGTIPGPYNVSPLNPKNPSAQDNYVKVEKFLDDYCGGIPLQVIGWEYATGPMEITYLAMLAGALYGWEYDIESMVNEGLQWMHVYGTGEDQWTYDTIKDTFLCPVLRGRRRWMNV